MDIFPIPLTQSVQVSLASVVVLTGSLYKHQKEMGKLRVLFPPFAAEDVGWMRPWEHLFLPANSIWSPRSSGDT